MDILELMKKDLERRRYSKRTVQTYLFCFHKFLNWIKKEPRKISKKDIEEFLQKLNNKGFSASTLNLYLQAIKYPLQYILNKRNIFVNLPFSKTPKKLPAFLTKEEIKLLIGSIGNLKHKLMIELLYSSGLRISELINLKVKDLEFDSNFGWVLGGKGNKDRLFIIAQKIKGKLQQYIKEQDLKYENLLFSGRRGMYSAASIQEIVKQATKKSKINKKVHPHTLRHSFATHLIEDGYSLVSVQSLMGHNSPETTMIYVHMAKPKIMDIKSPYDAL